MHFGSSCSLKGKNRNGAQTLAVITREAIGQDAVFDNY